MAIYSTSLDIGDYVILQDTDDYAFSQDSVFLVNLSNVKEGDKVLDLGCGCGVLATLAVVKKGAGMAMGIETQDNIAKMARESVRLNNLQDKIEIINNDVLHTCDYVCAGSFDKVLCNPPYYPNEDDRVLKGKDISRIESGYGIRTFINATSYALKNGGDLWISYKANRLATLLHSLKEHNLEPKEMTLIYPTPSKDVDIVIIKARKGAKEGLIIKNFLVKDKDGNYTNQYKELYNG